MAVIHEQETFHVKNNAGKGLYPVGSGNALTAGLSHGLIKSWPFHKILQFASSCATAHAMTKGIGKVDTKKINSLLPFIQVSKHSL